jgi:DNA-binding FadR family transcriptional regulator
MTVQQILDQGRVDDQTDVPTLEEARRVLEFQIAELEASSWGAMGLAQMQKHKKALVQVQEKLNRHRGLDGMTPLSA